MTRQEIIQALRDIVAEADAMKSAYFFTPPAGAGARRSYEKRHSHDKIEWEEGGHTYSAAYTVRCSCKNVYTDGVYTRDGKKTTLTAIKNSLRRMEAGNIPDALYSLCFSYCMDGGTELRPISQLEAVETICSWRAEDPEILAGLEYITAEQFRRAWNETVKYLMGGNEK